MPTYRFENYTINANDRLLLKNGTRVDIWPKAADVLLLLVAAFGDVVPKDRFMEALWPEADVGEATLTTNIHHLRKVFNGDAAGGFIETLPRRGYRISVPVQLESEIETAVDAADETDSRLASRGIAARWPFLARIRRGVAVVSALTAAASLALFIVARTAPPAPKLSDAAIRSYELGRFYFQKSDGPSQRDLREALTYFKRLTQQAPRFSDGFALLAEDEIVLTFSMQPVRDVPQLEAQAVVNSNQAALLNPRSPETLTSLAAVEAYVNQKPEAAEVELGRALALAPNDASPHLWSCWLYFDENQLVRARRECQSTLALEPGWSDTAALIAWTYYLDRDYPDAIAYYRQLLAAHHRSVDAMFGLALAFELSGDFGHAIPMIRRMAHQLNGQPGGASIGEAMLADAYARMGRRRVAERLLRGIDLSRVDDKDNEASISIASLFTALGRKADALAWLARLSPDGRHMYEGDPRLDSLRHDPRFTAWHKA
ncbi:MAG: winged helix-turn-helix domain-containing protein [Candidatus Eremiobacteraeota bacterium]|nr:winged helix-turn-helix domain-containing protein [Candidatus Eremiobacteraeota bacterium]MBC5823930.1 winged helix-turn-helix domain-containing protein [Candidatus Eremiobacteraeota bacterium]